jgi:hypothetical protein
LLPTASAGAGGRFAAYRSNALPIIGTGAAKSATRRGTAAGASTVSPTNRDDSAGITTASVATASVTTASVATASVTTASVATASVATASVTTASVTVGSDAERLGAEAHVDGWFPRSSLVTVGSYVAAFGDPFVQRQSFVAAFIDPFVYP